MTQKKESRLLNILPFVILIIAVTLGLFYYSMTFTQIDTTPYDGSQSVEAITQETIADDTSAETTQTDTKNKNAFLLEIATPEHVVMRLVDEKGRTSGKTGKSEEILNNIPFSEYTVDTLDLGDESVHWLRIQNILSNRFTLYAQSALPGDTLNVYLTYPSGIVKTEILTLDPSDNSFSISIDGSLENSNNVAENESRIFTVVKLSN